MYKLILADDERKIRTVLNSIIDWKGLNLTKVCECDNGDQLVQKVLEEKPDIVLSDMRMPGIHGKELLEKLREIDKNLRVIVISGFDDFTYLKQAVVSGVEDYIMKPIDIKELNKALVNAIAKINENEKYNEHIDANNKNKLFDNILNDEITVESLKCLMDFSLEDKFFLANVCSWNLNSSQSSVEKRVRQYANNFKAEDKLILNDTLENGNFICIIKNGDIKDIVAQMEYLRKDVENKCETKTYIGISPEGRSFDMLATSFRESKNILLSLAVCEPTTSCAQRSGNCQFDFPLEAMRKVSHQGNIDNIFNIINGFVENLGDKIGEISISDVKRFQDEIIYRIRYVFNLLNGGENCCVIDELENNLKNFIDLDLIIDDIIEKSKNIQFKTTSKRNATCDMAEKIRCYIDKHLCEKITLEELSNHFYLNKEYLSRIFKQHFGVGVFDYIDAKRIRKSNEMLEEGKTISEIVDEIGFYDESHFYKKYKKIMGFNPTQYKG